MKKQYLTVLFTLICVFGLGLGARAQEQDTVVTNVPFDFVAGGQVLPAGTYRVSRVDSTSGSRELEISSYETRASVFVIPTVFDDVQSDKAQLNFEHLGGKYFLSAIEDTDWDIRHRHTPCGYQTCADATTRRVSLWRSLNQPHHYRISGREFRSQELYQSMPEFPVIRQPTALRREGKQATFSIVQILKLRLWRTT